jgi:F420-dependent oxidoreductase-like protein
LHLNSTATQSFLTERLLWLHRSMYQGRLTSAPSGESMPLPERSTTTNILPKHGILVWNPICSVGKEPEGQTVSLRPTGVRFLPWNKNTRKESSCQERRSGARLPQMWSAGIRAERIMKLGLHLYEFSWPGGASQFRPTLVRIAQAAEKGGFDRITVMDHVWQSHYLGGPEHEVLSCYTTLAFLAAHTERIELSALATASPYWHPVLLAKTVTTLDVLSGGRAWLGIGAGDYEEEARGSGLPFPPAKERYEMLEEMIQICLRMWHGEQGDERPFEGKHYRIERPLNLPQSLRRPHPPILIAGSGEQKTLRLVARYANACNLGASPQIPRKLEVLRQHCEAEGRDYDTIEKTCAFAFDVGEDGSKVNELIEQLRWLAGMGIQTVLGVVPHVDRVKPLEIIGQEVIPAVANF